MSPLRVSDSEKNWRLWRLLQIRLGLRARQIRLIHSFVLIHDLSIGILIQGSHPSFYIQLH